MKEPQEPVICRHDIPWPRCLVCHSPPYRTVPGEQHIKNNGSTEYARALNPEGADQ